MPAVIVVVIAVGVEAVVFPVVLIVRDVVFAVAVVIVFVWVSKSSTLSPSMSFGKRIRHHYIKKYFPLPFISHKRKRRYEEGRRSLRGVIQKEHNGGL